MSAKIIKIDPLKPEEKHLKEAAKIIREGGLVIIPTETVYGIAANSANARTMLRLAQIKQRPKDKLFSLHIADKKEVEVFAQGIPVAAYKLMSKFWPGPLTLILQAKDKATIGIRLPDNAIATKIIQLAAVPVVCPSANISGKAAPTNFNDAIKDLEGLVDLALDAGPTSLGMESTVADLNVEPLQILREGAIAKDKVLDCVCQKIVLFVCTGNSCRSVMAKGLLENKLRQQGRNDVLVLSAGIMMVEGLGASFETKELLKQEGIDVSAHHSQRVTVDMLNKSDIILVMDRLHERRILEMAPQVNKRLFLLKEFANADNNSLDIPDPIGRSKEFYENTFAIIKEAIEKVSRII